MVQNYTSQNKSYGYLNIPKLQSLRENIDLQFANLRYYDFSNQVGKTISPTTMAKTLYSNESMPELSRGEQTLRQGSYADSSKIPPTSPEIKKV